MTQFIQIPTTMGDTALVNIDHISAINPDSMEEGSVIYLCNGPRPCIYTPIRIERLRTYFHHKVGCSVDILEFKENDGNKEEI